MSRVAIVTGGGRGVGRVIATALARDGFSVAVTSRTSHELEETVQEITDAGGNAVAHAADATDPAAVSEAVAAFHCELGRIDVLFNNAGAVGAIGPTWEADDEDWWHVVESNLRSTFNYVRVVVPRMLEQGGGRIVNVSSYAGTRPSPFMSAYAAAKAAAVNFSESLAAEAADSGVKVFTITPGLFRSALIDRLTAPESRRWLPDVGRSGWVGADRIAALACFVASGRGDALAGRLLHALDDLDELLEHVDEIGERDLLTVRLRRWVSDD